MHCPKCDQSYSDFQSICPNCFVELVSGQGHARGPATSDAFTVAWPSMADFTTLEMPRISLDSIGVTVPSSLGEMADRDVAALGRDAVNDMVGDAVARVPDRNMREVAHETLERAAGRIEERIPEGLRDMAHNRLQHTVDQLAEMVPDESARAYAQRQSAGVGDQVAGRLPNQTPRQMGTQRMDQAKQFAKQQAANAQNYVQQQAEWTQQQAEWAQQQEKNAQYWAQQKAEQAQQRADRRAQAQQAVPSQQRQRPQRPPNAQSPQEIAPSFDAWYKATQSPEETPAPANTTDSNVGCLNLIMAGISLMIPGAGQIIVGPRGFGALLFFVWLFALGSHANGFETIVRLVAAVTALVGFGRSK